MALSYQSSSLFQPMFYAHVNMVMHYIKSKISTNIMPPHVEMSIEHVMGESFLKWTLTHKYYVFQKRCRDIGGYFVKVDTEAENNWIASHKPTSIITSFTLNFAYIC